MITFCGLELKRKTKISILTFSTPYEIVKSQTYEIEFLGSYEFYKALKNITQQHEINAFFVEQPKKELPKKLLTILEITAEYTPIYFVNPKTKTKINQKLNINKRFSKATKICIQGKNEWYKMRK